MEDKEMELLLSDKEVKINDKKVIVHKFSMLNTIRLASKLSRIASIIIEDNERTAGSLSKLTYSGESASETQGVRLLGLVELLGIIGDDGADLIADILEKSTTLTAEEVEEISAEDGLDLMFDIYEVNKSFFTKFTKKLEDRLGKKQQKEEKPKKKKA